MGSTSNLLRVLWAVFMFATMSPMCVAQERRDTAANSSIASMAIQTYEIGDLVFSVPDYTLEAGGRTETMRGASGFAAGMGGGGGGMGASGFGRGGFAGRGEGVESRGQAAPASGSLPLTMESVIQVIQATVEPDSWLVNGGGEGQATGLGTALIVRQTPDVQQAIGRLLGDLRDGSARRRSMTIDARWLLLDSDGLAKLAVVGDDGETKINREVLAQFTRQPTSLRGFVSCFSGQAVYLTSGAVRSNVSSYIPVVGSVEPPKPEIMFASHEGDSRVAFVSDGQGVAHGGRSVGYQPVITTNNFGVQIELRPTRLYPDKAAVVDLRSTITFPASPSNNLEAIDAPADALAPQVDRLAIQTQELATTLRVPLGEPVLVGGMTDMAPRPGAAGDATGDPAGMAAGDAVEKPQLYLILEVK